MATVRAYLKTTHPPGVMRRLFCFVLMRIRFQFINGSGPNSTTNTNYYLLLVLKRKFNFLMSFRDFAELSFFLVPPGIVFCALSFLFFEDVCFYVEKMMTGN